MVGDAASDYWVELFVDGVRLVASCRAGETIGFRVWAYATTPSPGAGGCVRVPAGRAGIR